MTSLTFAIPDEFKSEMKKLSWVNWSELANKELVEELKRQEMLKEFNELVSLLFNIVEFVPTNEYKEYIPKARELLKTHLKDVEFLALALKLDCLIWTYEELFFDIGFGISTKQTSSKINLFEL